MCAERRASSWEGLSSHSAWTCTHRVLSRLMCASFVKHRQMMPEAHGKQHEMPPYLHSRL